MLDLSRLRILILFIGAVFALFLVFILWIKGKNRPSFYYSWIIFFLSIFCFFASAYLFFEQNKVFWFRGMWWGAMIAPALMVFVYDYTGRKKFFAIKSFLWYFLGSAIVIAANFTPYFTKSISVQQPYPYYYDEPGLLDPLGRFYIGFGVVLGFFYLFRNFFRMGKEEKMRTKYFIIASALVGIGGLFIGVLIPLFYRGFAFIDIFSFLLICVSAFFMSPFLRGEFLK